MTCPKYLGNRTLPGCSSFLVPQATIEVPGNLPEDRSVGGNPLFTSYFWFASKLELYVHMNLNVYFWDVKEGLKKKKPQVPLFQNKMEIIQTVNPLGGLIGVLS